MYGCDWASPLEICPVATLDLQLTLPEFPVTCPYVFLQLWNLCRLETLGLPSIYSWILVVASNIAFLFSGCNSTTRIRPHPSLWPTIRTSRYRGRAAANPVFCQLCHRFPTRLQKIAHPHQPWPPARAGGWLETKPDEAGTRSLLRYAPCPSLWAGF